MADLNHPQQVSSSSNNSSSDDQHVQNGITVAMETHYNSKCRYKRRHIPNTTMYVLIRKCQCGEYEDCSYMLKKGFEIRLTDDNRKDVHVSRECFWDKAEHGQRQHTLMLFCSCKAV